MKKRVQTSSKLPDVFLQTGLKRVPWRGDGKADNLDADPLHDPDADDQDEKWVAESWLHERQCCENS